MPDYQICSLDSGGLKVAYHVAACVSDREALAVARDLIKTGGVAEVWAGPRHVEEVSMPHRQDSP
jgi:hypothetical protein